MTEQTRQIAFGLERIASFSRAARWQASTARGLNPTQTAILARVARRPERVADLASHLGVTPATTSDSVAALERKGLVERRADARDRRVQRIAATAAGAALAADADHVPDVLAAAIEGLPAADRAVLLRSMVRVVRDLQERRAVSTQRMCLTCRHFRPHAHEDAQRPHHCTYVDAAFGDADLRIECGEHEEAAEEERARTRARFDAVS